MIHQDCDSLFAFPPPTCSWSGAGPCACAVADLPLRCAARLAAAHVRSSANPARRTDRTTSAQRLRLQSLPGDVRPRQHCRRDSSPGVEGSATAATGVLDPVQTRPAFSLHSFPRDTSRCTPECFSPQASRVSQDASLHVRSCMPSRDTKVELRVRRTCLVCDFAEEVWEAPDTDAIGQACSRCRAPTERVSVLEQRKIVGDLNHHAVALGRLGGLKGGPARAAKLTARRRRDIARQAARARWRPTD